MDDEAFDALFAAHFPTVVRTVTYVVSDRAIAEEITQDAFVKLLRHWSKVSAYERPDLWVRRVALRDAQRERRRGWRRPEIEASAAPPAMVAGPEAGRSDVLAAVSTLAPKQRAIVVLFYFEDRPMDEIAEIVGCSTSTAWSQLHNARKRLALTLAEEVADDVR
ncbi:MAG TPA: sigma-70 family RNA polymerase sigma factor [Nocardioidaceae bacterium]|nr:sigma-70 family RNA polymerase sigma factor [Nocardioidaceae bacterium]